MRNDEADVIGSEQLVQRFVDNELSSAERVQLLMRLGRDEALRGRLIELEQIAAGADRLSRPAVPAGFVPCVMERTAPPRSLGQRLRETLWTPRALQWNLASALGTVCVALLIAGAAVTLEPSRTASVDFTTGGHDRSAVDTCAGAARHVATRCADRGRGRRLQRVGSSPDTALSDHGRGLDRHAPARARPL